MAMCSALMLTALVLACSMAITFLAAPIEGSILMFFVQEVSMLTILAMWLVGHPNGTTMFAMLKMALAPLHC